MPWILVWNNDKRDTSNFIGEIMGNDLCNLNSEFCLSDSIINFLSKIDITGDCKWMQAMLGNKMSGNALESCFLCGDPKSDWTLWNLALNDFLNNDSSHGTTNCPHLIENVSKDLRNWLKDLVGTDSKLWKIIQDK
jgi:hypothetical protein